MKRLLLLALLLVPRTAQAGLSAAIIDSLEAIVPNGEGVVIQFQQGKLPDASYSGCEDTYVEIDNAYACTGDICNFNYGAATGLLISNRISPAERFILAKWDIATYIAATYPNGFDVYYAAIGLYMTSAGTGAPAGGTDLNYISPILKPWIEGTASGSYQAGSASYDSTGYTGAAGSWNGTDQTGMDVSSAPDLWWRHTWWPGTTDSETDSSTIPQGHFGILGLWNSLQDGDGNLVAVGGEYTEYAVWSKSTQPLGWYWWNVTKLVSGWNSGEIQNNGVYWTNSEGASIRVKTFASSEYTTDADRRPLLVVVGRPRSASSGSGGTVSIRPGGIGGGIGGGF